MRRSKLGVVARALATGSAALGLVLTMQGTAFADVFKGGPGDDTIRGTNGADTIYGYRGADTLYGRGGKDEVRGGDGRDRLYGGARADRLIGGPKKDRLYGSTGHDKLFGGKGPDVVKGGKGNDKLAGGPGNDTIRARDGMRDRIFCGTGKDVANLDWRDRLGRRHGCERVRRFLTYTDLHAIYGTKLGDAQTVRRGLKSLNNQMNKPTRSGQISKNAKRASALLATLVNESNIEYNALQPGTATYRGRGFIQLTGRYNYSSAGSFFGVNLVNEPYKARRLAWSAKIARWYWTVARPDTNRHADALDMYEVNRNIGYPESWAEDEERCDDFKKALRRLRGSVPSGITCHK